MLMLQGIYGFERAKPYIMAWSQELLAREIAESSSVKHPSGWTRAAGRLGSGACIYSLIHCELLIVLSVPYMP